MQSASRFDNLNRFIFGRQSPAEEDAFREVSEAGLFLQKNSTESKMDLIVSDTADITALNGHSDGLTTCKRNAVSGYAQFTLSNATKIEALFPQLRHGIKMFFIGHKEHSHSRLNITPGVFNRLVESAEIFPAVKDSILHMGRRDRELEVAPPPARSRVKFEKIDSSLLACGFELVYGLRFIERNARKADRSTGKPWSLRQFFTYNMTHYTEQDSRWVFFGLPEVIRRQVDAYLAESSPEIVKHPFDIHVLLVSAVIRMWRPYFMSLTDLVEDHRRMIAGTDISDKKAVQKAGTNMMSELKLVENDILDAFLAVRATKDTLVKIQSLFKSVSAQEGLASNDDDCHNLIAQAISDQMREVDMLIEQATSLQQKTTSLSASIADFLNLANAYWQEGNAKAVAGLSVIATIFLPITVVFGFFSTTFMQKDNSSGIPFGRWWLLLACGLPLSFVTMVGWYLWVHRTGVKRRLSRIGRLFSRFGGVCPGYFVEPSSTADSADRRLEDIIACQNTRPNAAQSVVTNSHAVVLNTKQTASGLVRPDGSISDSGVSDAGFGAHEKQG